MKLIILLLINPSRGTSTVSICECYKIIRPLCTVHMSLQSQANYHKFVSNWVKTQPIIHLPLQLIIFTWLVIMSVYICTVGRNAFAHPYSAVKLHFKSTQIKVIFILTKNHDHSLPRQHVMNGNINI